MKTLSTIAALTFFVAAGAPAFAQTAQQRDTAPTYQAYSNYNATGRSVAQNPGFRCNSIGASVSPNGNPSMSDPHSC